MTSNSIKSKVESSAKNIKSSASKKKEVIEYLRSIGGMDANFFDDNSIAEDYGHALREKLKGINEVEVEITYRCVRLKLKE